MAVLWLSGSAEPGASVNVAPGEEKSLCPDLWETQREGGEKRGPEVVGEGERGRERAPVLAKGSVQRIVCKGIRTEDGPQACGARGRHGEGLRLCMLKGALKRGSAMEAGLFCSQSVCDLLPATRGSHSLPPTPFFF